MNRKSITQEYFILVTNEQGNFPTMRKDETKSGIVVAGFMDLLSNDIITVEKKKITVIKELPYDLFHLTSLYTYLKEKTRSTDKLMSDYIASTSSRIKQLITELGESLFKDNIVTKEEGGLFGNKIVYIPEKNYKYNLIHAIKSAIAKEKEITPHDMTLIYILKETKNLYQYFSQYESEELKATLKELKKNPQNKQLKDMINYVSDITVIAMTCLFTSSN